MAFNLIYSGGVLDVSSTMFAIANLIGMDSFTVQLSDGSLRQAHNPGRLAALARVGGVVDSKGQNLAFRVAENTSGGYILANFSKGYLIYGAKPYHNIYANSSPSEWHVGSDEDDTVDWLSIPSVVHRLKRLPPASAGEVSHGISLTTDCYAFSFRDWQGYNHTAAPLSGSVRINSTIALFSVDGISAGDYDWGSVDSRFNNSDYQLGYVVQKGNGLGYNYALAYSDVELLSGTYTLRYVMALFLISDLNAGQVSPVLKFPHTLVEQQVTIDAQVVDTINVNFHSGGVSFLTENDSVTPTMVAFKFNFSSVTTAAKVLHSSTVTYINEDGVEVTENGPTVIPDTALQPTYSHTFSQRAHDKAPVNIIFYR